MVKHKKLSGSREVADLARETSSSGLSAKKVYPPQEPPAAISCSGSSSKGRISAVYDSLVMTVTREKPSISQKLKNVMVLGQTLWSKEL
ncbi:hypothetical protein E2C01_070634 [Portunus trituberculatus]|uniref:Uncharacterized protein n=1 Tax=Portunus trituberculatus TaxID=210409 RepID=A0A5B7I405_PORTR|nr:hypothetical protein [Portunus trituberculatus]